MRHVGAYLIGVGNGGEYEFGGALGLFIMTEICQGFIVEASNAACYHQT